MSKTIDDILKDKYGDNYQEILNNQREERFQKNEEIKTSVSNSTQNNLRQKNLQSPVSYIIVGILFCCIVAFLIIKKKKIYIKEEFVTMKNKTNFTKNILLILYAVVLTLQLVFFVPYGRYALYTSSQNVPHTELISVSYHSFFWNNNDVNQKINKTLTKATGEDVYDIYKINYRQLALQTGFITLLFGVAYFIAKNSVRGKDNQ